MQSRIVHCFTSASFAYLDRVRVLAATVREYHPDWKIWFCLSDREPEGFVFDVDNEDIDALVRIEELPIENFESWVFEHNIVELCTAVKGMMLNHILDSGAEKVVYLDPDIALFSPLHEVVTLLDEKDIVLTPHQLRPDTNRHEIIDNEIGSLKFGVYNLGFVAVSNRSAGRNFATWWKDRLLEFCFDDVPNGLFTDQRWCDHVPALFDNVHILKHPGYNVASWNLSQREISIDIHGEILVNESPLRFFHFTKISWIGEVMLEKYCRNRVEVFELIKWYKSQLQKYDAGVSSKYWAFDLYIDGSKIAQSHRTIYRSDPRLKATFSKPFEQGALNGPLRASIEDRFNSLENNH